MKKVVNVSPEDAEDIEVGKIVVLASSEYVGPTNCYYQYGEIRYWFCTNADGVSGNMSGERATKGWRGTTNDWSVYAHGVWKIVDIGESRLWHDRPRRSGFPGVRKTRVVLETVEGGDE